MQRPSIDLKPPNYGVIKQSAPTQSDIIVRCRAFQQAFMRHSFLINMSCEVSYLRNKLKWLPLDLMKRVVWLTIPVPCHVVNALQLIWRSNTCKWNHISWKKMTSLYPVFKDPPQGYETGFSWNSIEIVYSYRNLNSKIHMQFLVFIGYQKYRKNEKRILEKSVLALDIIWA